ncbi:hypothetical protein ABFS82_14G163300 [Erythranthe guttata]
MFYSHTFLARKGPLGTVWCAAHLQHRLKKSHYVATNVPSTVERIMFPEVPIALRMSGHLLLGVVRIYSKQVDYLYEDCNEIRITINRVFTTVNVNLPNDATHASFKSVTLPENFNLDSFELDDFRNDWSEDSHLLRQEDITLTEQIPTDRDPYIVIHFNEHDLKDSSFTGDNSESTHEPMDEDVPPPPDDFDARSPPSNDNNNNNDNLFGNDDINVGNRTPQDLPSIELMRDARRNGFDFNNSPKLPDRAEPDKFLEEQFNRDNKTSSTTPSTPETTTVVPPADDHVPSFENHQEQHSPVRLDSPIHFVHESPEMELQPTPPVAQPARVRRNRRQLFDETTVLSNEYLKNNLKYTKDILRERRSSPLDSLHVWKRNKRSRMRKEGVLYDPFITGSCADLESIHRDDFVSSKLDRFITEETNEGTGVVATDMEIETLRNNDCAATPERFIPSDVLPSPNKQGYSTPVNPTVGSPSRRTEYTDGDGIFHTPDNGPSNNFFSEIETPNTGGGTFNSDIPELVPSPGELGFLEQDGSSTIGSEATPEFGMFSKNQGTPELQQLSSRTRALAQYLKRQSSATPISDNNSNKPPGDLSLKKILEGKPKKICARMFYETLVLKNYGLIDTNQEKPYDDIILRITPKLSKGQFSG